MVTSQEIRRMFYALIIWLFKKPKLINRFETWQRYIKPNEQFRSVYRELQRGPSKSTMKYVSYLSRTSSLYNRAFSTPHARRLFNLLSQNNNEQLGKSPLIKSKNSDKILINNLQLLLFFVSTQDSQTLDRNIASTSEIL